MAYSAFAGDCFIIFPPYSQENTAIFGRNSSEADEVQEVIYYAKTELEEKVKCDGGAEIDSVSKFAMILQKSRLNETSIWGADFGANEKNISIGVLWSDEMPVDNSLRSTDLVRLALERSCSSSDAVNQMGSLVESNGCKSCNFSLVICDPGEAWLFSVGGKFWAAQKFTEGFHRLPNACVGVGTTIDKSSDHLAESLKNLGLWSGEGDLNFSNCFSSPGIAEEWSGLKPSGDGSYIVTNMFETLRSAATDKSRSSSVSVLSSSSTSCYWFTATPNPQQSVFKPFLFAPNPKISPLTKVLDNESVTLLHKLHGQRKPEAIRDLMNLEVSCVNELFGYLNEHPSPTTELDELMKDCVEAEVKFYR